MKRSNGVVDNSPNSNQPHTRPQAQQNSIDRARALLKSDTVPGDLAAQGTLELPENEGRSKHAQLNWNPEKSEWFCPRCGRTSDHQLVQDARIEVEQFECKPAPADCAVSRDSNDTE
jgi:hypothetical protein